MAERLKTVLNHLNADGKVQHVSFISSFFSCSYRKVDVKSVGVVYSYMYLYLYNWLGPSLCIETSECQIYEMGKSMRREFSRLLGTWEISL